MSSKNLTIKSSQVSKALAIIPQWLKVNTGISNVVVRIQTSESDLVLVFENIKSNDQRLLDLAGTANEGVINLQLGGTYKKANYFQYNGLQNGSYLVKGKPTATTKSKVNYIPY